MASPLHIRHPAVSETVPERIAARTAAAPEAIAVIAPEGSLTYRALDEQSARLATHLRAAGAGRDALIAVCLERSCELVVALLGVLRAGAAYVPIDPGYPAARIAHMLADSGARILITDTSIAPQLPAFDGTLVRLDADRDAIARLTPATPPAPPAAGDLAYAIYTSGSTGTPKGVLIEHGALASQIAWMQEAFPLLADDRVLQKTPVSFDASVWEFWAPLAAGATLVMAGPGVHRDPAQLVAAVRAHGITTLQLVPSVLQLVVDEPAFHRCRTLRRLFCGGEALPTALAARVVDRLPACTVINLYGPTEATIQATSHVYRPGCDTAATVPIGRAVARTTLHVLDEESRPVADGVAGELFIGGVQLARGYHRQPELTAARFFAATATRERLYRTGDLVRARADGALEFVGRADQQLKIRGVRVEPGEIEHTLTRLPGITHAAVTPFTDATGAMALAAFVQGDENACDPDAIRARLQDMLPEAMVPAVITRLDRLPLSPSGKLDRKALPAPAAGRTLPASVGGRPVSTDTERRLATLWSRLLQCEITDAASAFFALGGHSLTAIRLAADIRSTFGVDLPLHELMASSSLAAMAARIDALGAAAVQAPGMPQTPGAPSGTPAPLTESQRQLWFIDQLNPGSPAYNVTACHELRGPLDPGALARAVDALVARHEPLRTTFPAEGGEPCQLVGPPAAGLLEVRDLTHLPASSLTEAAAREAREHAAAPFDLAHGPLFRARLLRLAPDEHWLLLCIHHIATDGWSMGVIEAELALHYRRETRRDTASPPAMAVTFSDFARAQTDSLPTAVAEHLPYWRDLLDGAPARLALPADRPAPATPTMDGGLVATRWPRALVSTLRAVAQRENTSVFSVVLALSHALLGRVAGTRDLVTGSPTAGRPHPGLHPLVGFFVNMIPLRGDLTGDPSLSELVRRTARQVRETMRHASLPFTALVRELRPDPEAASNPIFQVVVLHVRHEALLQLPGIEVTSREYRPPASRFDLILEFHEYDDHLEVQAEYSSDLFEPATVERLLARLSDLAGRALAAPEAPMDIHPLDGVPPLGPRVRARAFWERTIPRLPPPPDMPQDASTPAHGPAAGRAGLSADRWLALVSKARTHDASPAALALAALAGAVALWSKAPQFTLPVRPRGRPTLPLAWDESGDTSFARRLALVQQNLRELLAHVCAGVDIPAHAAAPVMLATDLPDEPGAIAATTEAADATGIPILLAAEAAQDGGLVFRWETSGGPVTRGVGAALVAAAMRWLETLATVPDAWTRPPALQARTIFPPDQVERRTRVNATGAPIPGGFLFDGFLARAREQPDAPAVIAPARSLSYRELRGRACALAHRLRDAGVDRNRLVAVVMQKGWEQVVAALGIQLAGGAYLPVDSEWPQDRIGFLITHGEVPVVLTQSALRPSIRFSDTLPVIDVDTLPESGPAEPPVVPGHVQTDLAYVIFTSGSTGLPKGVMIDHRGALNTCVDLNARFRVGPGDRVLALSRLSFDLSVYDIFGLLAAGGALVLPAADLARDPAHWAELVRTHRVTLWNTVPALMQLLVDYAGGRRELVGDSLRVVMMSGDWIPLPLPDQISALVPGVTRISMGGATEASIWSIHFPIERVDPAWRSVPYGRPMVNQTFHVLHENLSPCPDHVVGELFIGGIGVALGYWKDPEKTAARFITHPHTGERLYRTGDLGRYLESGDIEFLGREDFQVKIQGYRIELGEIEAALLACEGVRQAVVVARSEADGSRRLVAYVVPAAPGACTADGLRARLGERLPAYMVPPACVFLDRLPLSANGKVDARALPAPDSAGTSAAAAASDVVAPRNEFEEIIHEIWRQTLPEARFGVHENFFTLGGGSLSGTRMIFRIREAFSLEVPVRYIFDHPTVARMAAAVEQLLLADIDQTAGPV